MGQLSKRGRDVIAEGKTTKFLRKIMGFFENEKSKRDFDTIVKDSQQKHWGDSMVNPTTTFYEVSKVENIDQVLPNKKNEIKQNNEDSILNKLKSSVKIPTVTKKVEITVNNNSVAQFFSNHLTSRNFNIVKLATNQKAALGKDLSTLDLKKININQFGDVNGLFITSGQLDKIYFMKLQPEDIEIIKLGRFSDILIRDFYFYNRSIYGVEGHFAGKFLPLELLTIFSSSEKYCDAESIITIDQRINDKTDNVQYASKELKADLLGTITAKPFTGLSTEQKKRLKELSDGISDENKKKEIEAIKAEGAEKSASLQNSVVTAYKNVVIRLDKVISYYKDGNGN